MYLMVWLLPLQTIMTASLVFAAGSIVMAAIPTGGGIYEWGWIILLVGRFMVGVGVGEPLSFGIIIMHLCSCMLEPCDS